MKNLIAILAVILFSIASWAQSPEKMSYQAVVRNSENNLVANQSVGIRINILYGSTDGVSVYSETHIKTTNANGLLTLEVGAGDELSGDFSTILWSSGPYFLKTEIDPEGGSNYTITGVSQLLSVPYALHAKTAENISGTLEESDPVYIASVASKITASDTTNWNNKLSEEADGDASNELQALTISGDTIFLSDGGFVKLPASVAFSGSFDDLDNIPADLDTDATDDFDGVFSSLTGIPAGLSDGDDDTQLDEAAVDAFVANNGYLTAEVDGSVTNEIQILTISNDTIYLSGGGYVELPASSSFSGSFNDLDDIPADLDTDATDDFDGVFSSLTGIPAGLSDGDDDTFLDEATVDAYVANNGYLSAEVDGSVTNEIELPDQSASAGNFLTTNGTSPSWSAISFNDLEDVPVNLDTDDTDDFDGSFSSLSGIPAGLSDGDDDNYLDEAAVDAYVANNGYLTAEVDGSVTNEIELPDQSGHNGEYLTTDGSSVSWSTIGGSTTPNPVRAYLGSAQTVTNLVWTKILFSAESFDDDGDFNTTTAGFTAPSAGYYQVNAAVSRQGGSGDVLSIRIVLNGAAYAYGNQIEGSSFGSGEVTTVSDIVYCSTSDVITIECYLDDGSAIDLTAGAANTYISIFKIK